MGKSISTHNGSSASREHNLREEKAIKRQEHIKRELSKHNEILHDEAPREAYRRIFGEALEEYNARQERPERQIKDYYSHICRDEKKHAVYEMIVQIGDRNDTGIDAPTETACLREFYNGWRERNPNLECIGAYIHKDEGTVHMHIDYVPVAHGYSKGLSVQNGLVRALREQGFEKQGKDTAQIQWERRENKALEQICNQYGIEVVRSNEQRQHMDTPSYKRYAKELDSMKEAVQMEQHNLENLIDDYGEIAEKCLNLENKAVFLDDKVNIAKRAWNVLFGEFSASESEAKTMAAFIKTYGLEERYKAFKEKALNAVTQKAEALATEKGKQRATLSANEWAEAVKERSFNKPWKNPFEKAHENTIEDLGRER